MTKPAKPKRSTKLNEAEQTARFIETARKLGADERPEEFEKLLKKVAVSKKKIARSS